MDLSDFQAQSQVEYRLNLRSFYFLSLKLASNTAEAAFWNKDQAIIFQTVLDQQSELFTMFALWRGLRCLQWQLQVWLEKTEQFISTSTHVFSYLIFQFQFWLYKVTRQMAAQTKDVTFIWKGLLNRKG